MLAAGQEPLLQRRYRHDEWGAISFAVFLIVLGAFWLVYPNLWSEIGRFFSDLRPVYVSRVPIFLEPVGNHSLLYGIATEFFAIMSLWLFGLFAVRLYRHSYPRIVSETLTRAIFLLGLAFFSWQLQIDAASFRSIVPLVVVLAGVTLIVRGLWNILQVK